MKSPGNFREIFHHQYLHKYFHSNATPAQIWEFSKWLHERNEVNLINEVETQINIDADLKQNNYL